MSTGNPNQQTRIISYGLNRQNDDLETREQRPRRPSCQLCTLTYVTTILKPNSAVQFRGRSTEAITANKHAWLLYVIFMQLKLKHRCDRNTVQRCLIYLNCDRSGSNTLITRLLTYQQRFLSVVDFLKFPVSFCEEADDC